MNSLKNIVFDMDGVLWLGMTPMPDLPGFFAGLDELGLRYVFATNNASRTVEQYIEKFAKFGVSVEPWQILSSAETTAAVLAEQYEPGTRVYVVGGDGLRSALATRQFELVDLPQVDDLAKGVAILAKADPVEIAVVGFSPACNYGHLAAAAHFVNKGARFIGSNPDLSYPTEIGTFPGAGAIIKLVEVATDVEPTIIGKPFPYIFLEALKRLEGRPEETLMVGDRLNTDIRGALDVGMRTALVLSGIEAAEDVAQSDTQPEFVFAHIGEMLEALKAR